MKHSEETRAADEGFSQGGKSLGRLLVRALLSVLFLLSSLPIGFFWFVVLIVLLLAGLPLTVVWVGLPVLVLAAPVYVLGTGFERRRLAALLNTRLLSPFRPLPHGSVVTRARARTADPALWRGLLYLVLLFPIGLVELVVVFLLVVAARARAWIRTSISPSA